MISSNRQEKCFIHCHSAARLKNLITVSCKSKPLKSISPVVFALFDTRSLSNKSVIPNDFVTGTIGLMSYWDSAQIRGLLPPGGAVLA